MARVSARSRYSVYLTIIALFLVTVSTWMSWYVISNGYSIVGEYWLDHFDPIYGGGLESYRAYDALSGTMNMVKLFAVLWFLVALVFLARILSEDPFANSEFAVGGVLVAVGILMLGYFAWAFPAACHSLYVSGFFSSTTYDGRVYTGGPGWGFVLAGIACGVQALAVALRFKALFSDPQSRERIEPFEAPVIRTPPE
ncbi:MAG: hypothetical protein MUO94_03195 [Thermoplasmata archaeon]|nr:hypothetical protein [Thermoplasmata archaeon]